MKQNKLAISLVVLGVGLFFVGLFRQLDLAKPQVLPSGEEKEVINKGVYDYTPPDKSADNRLIIKKIGVDAVIYEGGQETLALGVWHLPRTSTPDKGGNTVLSAHRWKYKPPDPRTFYNLDKLEIGDEIKVYWEGREYNYKIEKIFEVTPDKVEVLAPSNKEELTLFTCAPLYSTQRRLVVKADLVESRP